MHTAPRQGVTRRTVSISSCFDQTMRTLLLRLSLSGSCGHFEESIDRIVDGYVVQGGGSGAGQKFAKFQAKLRRHAIRTSYTFCGGRRFSPSREEVKRKRWVRIELCLSEPNMRKYRGREVFAYVKALAHRSQQCT